MSAEPIYVVNDDQNLCGEFTRGNKQDPNWLQTPWYAISENTALSERFFQEIECENGGVQNCCKSLGYRYAGILIGVANISSERRSAEFIASKNIIESQSLSPSRYNLTAEITRKEAMKVVLNASQARLNTQCKEIFTDVANDWGCKYIETALENDFIAGNQQFRPDDYLTKVEALKLIFQARNIEKSYSTDSWQEDYISTALYLGYIESKFPDHNSLASRGWIFTVLAKTYPDFSTY